MRPPETETGGCGGPEVNSEGGVGRFGRRARRTPRTTTRIARMMIPARRPAPIPDVSEALVDGAAFTTKVAEALTVAPVLSLTTRETV